MRNFWEICLSSFLKNYKKHVKIWHGCHNSASASSLHKSKKGNIELDISKSDLYIPGILKSITWEYLTEMEIQI